MHVSNISQAMSRALVTGTVVVALAMLGSRAPAAGPGHHGGNHGHHGGGHHGHHHHGGGNWGGGNWGYGGYGLGGYGYSRGYSSTTFFGGLSIGYGGFGYDLGYGGYGYPSYNNYNLIGPYYSYGAGGVWGPYSSYGPLMLPSDQLYGPGALPAWSLPQALPAAGARVPAANNQPAAAEARPEARAAKARVPANDEALKRAFKFLDFGDQLFAEQKFLEAYLRYQSASTAAPDLADAHFRRGFALVALNHYERAAEAFRRGITLNPQWSASPFRLDDLYQDNRIAKQAHQEQLALALEKAPDNAQAMFLLGVSLYFDNQQERSRPFLQKALQLMKTENRNPPEAKPAEAAQPARGDDLEI